MADPGELNRRKRHHLDAVLGGDVGFATLTTGLERIRVRPRALPERDLDDVDLSTTVFGRVLSAPLLISCMTGGVAEAGPVNRALAAAAQHAGVAMGLGSGRAVLEDPATLTSFRVRDIAPDVLLFANLGAVQLGQYGPDDCGELVRLCDADALVLHLNAVQEAMQPAGDTGFGGVAGRIAATADALRAEDIPVVVKEVGFGMSDADIRELLDAGVAGIDVAGAGGTNWARVEAARQNPYGQDTGAQEADPRDRRQTDIAATAAAFADWGRPTAACILAARRAIDARSADVLLVGSGGIGDGVDALKALALGADLVGMARGLLRAASEGSEVATAAVATWVRQLTVAAWAAGAGSAAELGAGMLEPPA